MNDSATVTLTKALINLASVTPEDGGCQDLLAKRLEKIGFNITHLPFGDVKNLWAQRGNTKPLFVFAGHTDVVPTGPIEQWSSPPFSATEKDGYCYGRGAADMKSNIAAMITAVERLIEKYPHHHGSLAFLITSDEEGPSINGTQKVVEYLQHNNITMDWCIVGEPSSQQQIGDMLKVGRRGSLSATLTIHGKQGHIAYPHLADNAIHRGLAALHEVIELEWDKGNEFFPPTSFQISNIHAGTGANNVIPGEMKLLCNFRYSPEVTAEHLQQHVEAILEKHKVNFSIAWHHSGKPFLTKKGKLLDACVDVITENIGIVPELSTSGGTSDGRFIAPLGVEVVEMGVCNATIHQINECVKISDIDLLSDLYEKILVKLLSTK
jgi:succinyl-diaminopimelate desuccinylase